MKTAIELADEFPEQNLANIEPDAANILNWWGIEAVAMLCQQAEQIEALTKERDGAYVQSLQFSEENEALLKANLDCVDHFNTLKTDYDALKAALRWQPASGMLERIEALSNENLVLKADAERYRIFRQGLSLTVYVPIPTADKPNKSVTVIFGRNAEPNFGEALDAAIDAMKGKS